MRESSFEWFRLISSSPTKVTQQYYRTQQLMHYFVLALAFNDALETSAFIKQFFLTGWLSLMN
jgi:hypothetical protein